MINIVFKKYGFITRRIITTRSDKSTLSGERKRDKSDVLSSRKIAQRSHLSYRISMCSLTRSFSKVMTQISHPEARRRELTPAAWERARGAPVLFERKLSRDIAAPTRAPSIVRDGFVVWQNEHVHTHARTHACKSHALERIILASLHLGCSISFRSSYICCSLLR